MHKYRSDKDRHKEIVDDFIKKNGDIGLIIEITPEIECLLSYYYLLGYSGAIEDYLSEKINSNNNILNTTVIDQLFIDDKEYITEKIIKIIDQNIKTELDKVI